MDGEHMATIHSIETIISDAGVHGGQPIIAGTRIRVTDVVASHLHRGHNPDELAVNFNLDLGQVYAALAYYYQHKAEIDALMQSEADRAETYIDRLAQSGRLIRVE
jgi:uncharacterized protein (DUF433 family)